MEIERESLGPGEMAQWLREGSIFREDLSSVFSPQVRGLTAYVTLALTHLQALAFICTHPYGQTDTYRYTI